MKKRPFINLTDQNNIPKLAKTRIIFIIIIIINANVILKQELSK